MNKKEYVCPTMLERSVKVSMVCGSPAVLMQSGDKAVREDIFNQGRDEGFLNHNGIGVSNDIWDNNID